MLGVTHGLKPDHLVEVSAQVLRKGSDTLQAFLLGAVFAAGHVLTTAVFGLADLSVGWLMPEQLSVMLEGLAGPLMLVVGLWLTVPGIASAAERVTP